MGGHRYCVKAPIIRHLQSTLFSLVLPNPVLRIVALLTSFTPLAMLHAEIDFSTPYAVTALAGHAASDDVDGTGRAI